MTAPECSHRRTLFQPYRQSILLARAFPRDRSESHHLK
jgi:hypothetical protein